MLRLDQFLLDVTGLGDSSLVRSPVDRLGAVWGGMGAVAPMMAGGSRP